MGRFCRICKRMRPNEKFSGEGHKIHLCKDCQTLPKDKRRLIEIKDELYNFMLQSHISEKNLKRLETLSKHNDKYISRTAELISEMALITPYKRKRISRLLKSNKQLLKKLSESGLLEFYFEDYDDGYNREADALAAFYDECDYEEIDEVADEIDASQPSEEDLDWLRKQGGHDED